MRNSHTPSYWESLQLTRAIMVLLGLVFAVSITFLVLNVGDRAEFLNWTAPTADNVFSHGRVWTLLTGPLLESNVFGLVMLVFVFISVGSTMERQWGASRMFRFATATAVAGSIGSVLVNLALPDHPPALGTEPFTFALLIAFGRIYANQPVRFFGAVQMQGKQLVIGICALLFAIVLLRAHWTAAAALVAAAAVAWWLTSRKYNPRVMFRRWQLSRARAHLSVVPPSKPEAKKPKQERYLN